MIATARSASRALRSGRRALSLGVSSGSDSEFSIKGQFLEGRPMYFDSQSTTVLDPRVLDAQMPYLLGKYGNPHSSTHSFGWEAEQAVEHARGQVASLIGADSKEIVFTSGATESNNIAVKGIPRFARGQGKQHVITTVIEHKCVLDSCRALELEGFDVTYLPVDEGGLVRVEDVRAAIRDDTSLVSVMGVNNEIGVVQPLAEIGSLCRERGVRFHVDAAQMVGKMPLDVNEMKIDALSISGHKIYGPKGVGALYVRRRPRLRLEPLFSGGGQERGLRSGTLPLPLCVGLGEACEVAERDMDADIAHVNALAARLLEGLTEEIEDVYVNGDLNSRYMGCLNLSFSYVEGESLLMALKNIAISSGSACTSASLEPSYVLRSIGIKEDLAHTSLRFGIGRFTTREEVELAISLCKRHVQRLRDMSPLWEMKQKGIDFNTIVWGDAK